MNLNGPPIPYHTGNKLAVFSLSEQTQVFLSDGAFQDMLSATLGGEDIGTDAFSIYSYDDTANVWFKSRFDATWMASVSDKLIPTTEGVESFRVVYVCGVGVAMHLQPWLSALSKTKSGRFVCQDMIEVVNAFQPMALGLRKAFRKDMFTRYVKALLGKIPECGQINGTHTPEVERNYLASVKAWVDTFNPRRESLRAL